MNETPGETSKLLRIFIGEQDKLDHRPLYEELVHEAKKQGLAGATVLRGILSYGASSRIHTEKLLELSTDLPVVVEMVDRADKIDEFMARADELIKAAGCGALVTTENVEVRRYEPRK